MILIFHVEDFIFQILTFYFQFDDWIVTVILSADVTEIDAFGFKGIVKEFSFSFIIVVIAAFVFDYNRYTLKF